MVVCVHQHVIIAFHLPNSAIVKALVVLRPCVRFPSTTALSETTTKHSMHGDGSLSLISRYTIILVLL